MRVPETELAAEREVPENFARQRNRSKLFSSDQ
jgi:hypothetical protein